MNTYTWTSEYSSRALVSLPNMSATYQFGDVLAVGIDHWLPAQNLQGAIDWIANDGGLPVLTVGKPDARSAALDVHGLFGLEVWNARLAGSGAAQGDATGLWDRMLWRGKRIFAFAGDDATGLDDPALGHGWIEVQAAADDVPDLLSSLRHGAFYAATGASFTRLGVSDLTITAEAARGASLRFIGGGGRLLKAVTNGPGSYQVTGNEGYVRVEAVADDGGRAWSQPFFISRH